MFIMIDVIEALYVGLDDFYRDLWIATLPERRYTLLVKCAMAIISLRNVRS